jgi:CubicO group peptidase (beta-lactamase class C family)
MAIQKGRLPLFSWLCLTRRRRAALSAALVGVLGWGIQVWLSLPGAPARLQPEGPTAISEFLRGAVERGDVPGVVALVVNRDGVIYHEAFGKLNVAQNIDMPKDAIFRIASMTKPLTSIAIMMLVAEGKLSVDDEVGTYVPELAAPQVIAAAAEEGGTYETRPAARPITIRHLLTHTSGIAYTFFSPALALAQKTTGRTLPTELPLVHDPGERWTYGASTRVLGTVAEKIEGKSIDRILDERLHVPLGMRDTSFEVPGDKYGRVATTHQRMADGSFEERPNPEQLPVTVQGDGGLYSTAGDYGRFVQMLVHQGRLGPTRHLRTGMVNTIRRNQMGDIVVQTQPSTNPQLSKPFPMGAGADTWGFGFQITAAASTRPTLRRPGSLSWAGIFNTHFWIDPRAELGAVFVTQVLPFYDERVMQTLQGFEERIYGHLAED